MAVEFPYFFKTPVIVFEFLSGVPDLLARQIEGFGVVVAALAFDTVNLDVTAIFALISSLTHPGGCGYHFESSLLNAQAALERKKPALAPLLKIIFGSGDYYKAVTISANRHFVSAASHQVYLSCCSL
uniref:DUF1308 domain-containing protein n=1 Tax=Parascaris equorum TaxID=6256 RepID=A0A914RWR2_PAREQ